MYPVCRFLLLIFVFLPAWLCAQYKSNARDATLYAKAERLYHLKDNTPETDSIALSTYLSIIHLPEIDHANPAILVDAYNKAATLYQLTTNDTKALDLLNEALRKKQTLPPSSD